MKTLEKRNTTPSLSDVFFGSNWVDNLFAEAQPNTSVTTPAADILETESSFLITLALPGLTKKEVKLDLVENKLTVSGDGLKQDLNEGERWVAREISKGSFHRQFKLGNQIDSEKIDASFKDGLLKIELPKSEKASPKTISIK